MIENIFDVRLVLFKIDLAILQANDVMVRILKLHQISTHFTYQRNEPISCSEIFPKCKMSSILTFERNWFLNICVCRKHWLGSVYDMTLKLTTVSSFRNCGQVSSIFGNTFSVVDAKNNWTDVLISMLHIR